MDKQLHINKNALKLADGRLTRWTNRVIRGFPIHYTVTLSPEVLTSFVEKEKFRDQCTLVSGVIYKHGSPDIYELLKGDDSVLSGRMPYTRVSRKSILDILEDFKTLEEPVYSNDQTSFDFIADVYKKPSFEPYGTFISGQINLRGKYNMISAPAGQGTYWETKSLTLNMLYSGEDSNNEEIIEELSKSGKNLRL